MNFKLGLSLQFGQVSRSKGRVVNIGICVSTSELTIIQLLGAEDTLQWSQRMWVIIKRQSLKICWILWLNFPYPPDFPARPTKLFLDWNSEDFVLFLNFVKNIWLMSERNIFSPSTHSRTCGDALKIEEKPASLTMLWSIALLASFIRALLVWWMFPAVHYVSLLSNMLSSVMLLISSTSWLWHGELPLEECCWEQKLVTITWTRLLSD